MTHLVSVKLRGVRFKKRVRTNILGKKTPETTRTRQTNQASAGGAYPMSTHPDQGKQPRLRHNTSFGVHVKTQVDPLYGQTFCTGL